jgi:hypothetical protein
MTSEFQRYIRRHTGTVHKELTKECVRTIRCVVLGRQVTNEIDIFVLVYNRQGGSDAVWDVTGHFEQGKGFCVVSKTCLWVEPLSKDSFVFLYQDTTDSGVWKRVYGARARMNESTS